MAEREPAEKRRPYGHGHNIRWGPLGEIGPAYPRKPVGTPTARMLVPPASTEPHVFPIPTMDLGIVARRLEKNGPLKICGRHVFSGTGNPGEEHVPAEGNRVHSWDVPTRGGLRRRIVEFVPLSSETKAQRETLVALLKKHYPADFPG